MKQIQAHFMAQDPVIAQLWQAITDHQLKPIQVMIQPDDQLFSSLIESIVGQQLSLKAADTIWQRVVALLPDQMVVPEAIMAVETAELRQAGLSGSKAQYVKNVAAAILEKQLALPSLRQAPIEVAVTELSQIKGIGRWTAEMFLIFSLGHPDIFSVGDLGLRRAIERWYGVQTDHADLNQYLQISQNWQPYRSYASRVLWRSLELPSTFSLNVL